MKLKPAKVPTGLLNILTKVSGNVLNAPHQFTILSGAPVLAPEIPFLKLCSLSRNYCPCFVSLSLITSVPKHLEALQPCTLHVFTLKALLCFSIPALQPYQFFQLLALQPLSQPPH